MIKTKYLILGAGPAGLTFANQLKRQGETDFLVLEALDEPGGLCRSADVDGSPFDVGGGHFLDVRNPKVLDFVFSFMPEKEWDKYTRDSKIEIHGTIIGSPIEANIWQLKLEDQVSFLKAIAVAGCNLGVEMPKKFTDWIYWKLGDKIADEYMIPYNQKMFGDSLDELGTYWLDKLPNVSFDETLISCLERKAYGKQPAHAEFYYPKKYGYGEVWKRMGLELGDKLKLNEPVKTVDIDKRRVNHEYEADVIITTIPWASFEKTGISDGMKLNMKGLKSSSIVTEYVPQNIDTDAQWIYYPDPRLAYHRILVRHNFCPGSKGCWTETNFTRFNREDAKHEYFIMPYAYPLNTIGKPEKVRTLLDYTSSKNVFGLGRWGEHEHYNSDVVVDKALRLAEKFR